MLSLLVGVSALLPGGPPAMERREVLQRAAVGVFSGALSLGPAMAYDAIPTVSMDLDAAEKLRRDREKAAQDMKKQLAPLIKKIEVATTAEDFEAASDQLSIFVIGKGKGAFDGVNVKEVVGRIKASYARLPQKAYTCPKGSEKRDNAPCYTPGASVDAAYSAMMKELTPPP